MVRTAERPFDNLTEPQKSPIASAPGDDNTWHPVTAAERELFAAFGKLIDQILAETD